jgi:hypothetical protein
MSTSRIAATAMLCAALVGCFEEPIRDHLHLHLTANGRVVLTTIQEVAEPDVAEDNPALAARLDDARTAIEQGWDRWTRGFTELDANAERFTLERVDGVVRRAVRSAVVSWTPELELFLASNGVTAVVESRDGYHELALYTVGGTLATARQRDDLARRTRTWSRAVAAYLETAIALYDHLELRPERAVPCLSQLFDTGDPEAHPLDDIEGRLISELGDAIEDVAQVLRVMPGDAYSLNELSRLASDPLPVRLTVTVPGPIVEVEEFEMHESFIERRPVDLWRALLELEGRWLEPDLVTAMVTPLPADQQPDPDPVSFAAIPRWAGKPPSASEVEAAVAAALIPPDAHRVRWRAPVAPEADVEEFDPQRLIDLAEASLPR